MMQVSLILQCVGTAAVTELADLTTEVMLATTAVAVAVVNAAAAIPTMPTAMLVRTASIRPSGYESSIRRLICPRSHFQQQSLHQYAKRLQQIQG